MARDISVISKAANFYWLSIAISPIKIANIMYVCVYVCGGVGVGVGGGCSDVPNRYHFVPHAAFKDGKPINSSSPFY